MGTEEQSYSFSNADVVLLLLHSPCAVCRTEKVFVAFAVEVLNSCLLTIFHLGPGN